MTGNEGNSVIISDSYPHLPLDLFCMPRTYENTLSHIMIPEGMVKDRVKKMALEIVKFYERSGSGQPLTLLCVLKGAVRFLGELHHAMEKIIRARELDLELEQSFVRLQSYLNDRSVQEPVITGLHDPSEFKDKDILIVEDLIDTGRSMRALLARLDDLSPRRVKISSLLVKRIPSGIQVRPDFVGFEIPNEFVVGYALDYNEHFRDLPAEVAGGEFHADRV
ncbi:hypothetical protein CRM22_007677 [Opisthorchis felineus]|uniref:Phosphoribosyltransferase domain-containing protein n=1 Tax=Opisthorchis felineus TaxID=147828 RepID=A0A4S2LLN1_OPIFE|nr:hypothetical protein CRM22_007677 [Opisthorchis felineus]